MTSKPKFVDGEKVLCFHGPLLYEAKALKSSIHKDKQVKYYIHYAGWNKNWDEWVPESRVLKFNDTNGQRQKELAKMYSTSASGNTGKKKGTSKGRKSEAIASRDETASSGGSESRPSTPSKEFNPLGAPSATTGGRSNRSKQNATPISSASAKDDGPSNKDDNIVNDDRDEPPVKKRRGGSTSNASDKSVSSDKGSSSATATTCVTPTPGIGNRLDSFVDNEEPFITKIEVKIKIPEDLKQCLADDWDAVTRQHKLLDIPAKLTVQDIVDQYIASKKTSKAVTATKEVAIVDALNGVIEYFNVMLGSQLLYKFERQQYSEILQQYPETPVSRLYGSFHLLRLFVKLGSMLGFSALEEKSMQMLLAHLNDFLKFLVKNSASYFSMASFVNVAPEYHRNTQ